MRKFSLKFRQSVESAHISRWITNVMSRGVLDLDLDTRTREENINLPLEIFTCKTIVRLKIGSLIEIAKDASLPALKSLFLHCVWFSGREVETYISACHVLEELTILGETNWGSEQCRKVSCPTLERLTLHCKSSQGSKVSRRITFDTPNLAYLQYRDYVADEYPIVHFGSFVEAMLTLDSMRSISNPKNLIKGLRNVEIFQVQDPVRVYSSSILVGPFDHEFVF
ncbi:unnamed protein product [Arabis nemorensis]|uniref:F-box/LRR-repeat protein 15/At3g58940/PEG3-like LRR domain-containing protein n=1 Tax=Arabis nemorensis TaxID=586526 RepID=A0A565B9B4_9BRAS|nr:unnamed protein product [Arabis nemorensis]